MLLNSKQQKDLQRNLAKDGMDYIRLVNNRSKEKHEQPPPAEVESKPVEREELMMQADMLSGVNHVKFNQIFQTLCHNFKKQMKAGKLHKNLQMAKEMEGMNETGTNFIDSKMTKNNSLSRLSQS